MLIYLVGKLISEQLPKNNLVVFIGKDAFVPQRHQSEPFRWGVGNLVFPPFPFYRYGPLTLLMECLVEVDHKLPALLLLLLLNRLFEYFFVVHYELAGTSVLLFTRNEPENFSVASPLSPVRVWFVKKPSRSYPESS